MGVKLAMRELLPRALYERFNIEVLATTDSPLDGLADHAAIRESGWKGRIVPTFRPDAVVDPEFPGFLDNLRKLESLTGENTTAWRGYLRAIEKRREFFKSMGATATDHGHPTALTMDLSETSAATLFEQVVSGTAYAADLEIFRGQMLTEMARMSLDDGLVMQVHPGSVGNHNAQILAKYGRDMGADMPMATNYVGGLRPLLSRTGHVADVTNIT